MMRGKHEDKRSSAVWMASKGHRRGRRVKEKQTERHKRATWSFWRRQSSSYTSLGGFQYGSYWCKYWWMLLLWSAQLRVLNIFLYDFFFLYILYDVLHNSQKGDEREKDREGNRYFGWVHKEGCNSCRCHDTRNLACVPVFNGLKKELYCSAMVNKRTAMSLDRCL